MLVYLGIIVSNTDKGLDLKKSIAISFSIISILLITLSLLSIFKLTELSGITQKLYSHPLTITSSTKNIKFHITSMHRYMKDVVLANDDIELNIALAQVDSSERIVYEEFKVINDKYLGSEEEILKPYLLFVNWKAIRNEILFLKQAKQTIAAANLTKKRGERHVQKLYKEIDVLMDFADTKANDFLKSAINAKNTAIFFIIISLITILLIIVSVGVVLTKSLSSNELARKKQEAYLIHQSRLAQMGEMISMIAHQWRQPLSSISSAVGTMRIKYDLKSYDLSDEKERREQEAFMQKRLKNISNYVQVLSRTIDDFRNFYRVDKKSTLTDLDNVVKTSVDIIKSSLENNKIELLVEYHADMQIEVFSNELMQVILSVLKNSEENFLEREIQNPQIKIITNHNSIVIRDNGGGVPSNIVEKIFDPYFSTKNEKNGTGLGLYMSKIIVEDHHKGQLTLENVDDGVCFSIILD